MDVLIVQQTNLFRKVPIITTVNEKCYQNRIQTATNKNQIGPPANILQLFRKQMGPSHRMDSRGPQSSPND